MFRKMQKFRTFIGQRTTTALIEPVTSTPQMIHISCLVGDTKLTDSVQEPGERMN